MDILAILMSIITALMSMLQATVPPGFEGNFGNEDNTVIQEQIKDSDLTPEQLQEKYHFYYYRDFTDALIDVNNEEVGVNAIVKEDNPGIETLVGVYLNGEDVTIVALADTCVQGRLYVFKNATINLGGHTIRFENTPTGFDIRNEYGDPEEVITVNIVGTVDGSTIEIENDNAAAIANYEYTIANVYGGTYIARSTTYDVDENYLGTNGRQYQTRVLYCAKDAQMNVYNVNINTNAHCGNAYGIVNQGILYVENSKIYADAQYSDDGVDYIYLSVGIQNSGTSTIKNCNITGTHSGVSSSGTLYVDGGSYQSVGHGGIYISGNGSTSYVQNAVLKAVEYDGQYEINEETANNVGFYVGGAYGNDNLIVYIDNCEFYGTRAPFALRGTSGEQNNTIYISNSRINTDSAVRIDNDTHTLYLGKGNNFDKNNTTNASRVVSTNDEYHQDF